jgi:hypothetical protein
MRNEEKKEKFLAPTLAPCYRSHMNSHKRAQRFQCYAKVGKKVELRAGASSHFHSLGNVRLSQRERTHTDEHRARTTTTNTGSFSTDGSETFFLEPKESMAFYRFRIFCSATGIAIFASVKKEISLSNLS